MDKSTKLKTVAKGLMTGGILGAGGGVAASHQIQKNKYSARTAKGWDTKRKKALTKLAESDDDTIVEVKRAVKSLGHNMDHPTRAAADFIKSSLLAKVRKMIVGKPKEPKYGRK